MNSEIQQLLAQLQARYDNIGKVSSLVGYTNIEYLRNKLLKRGYNTKIDEVGNTVVLVPLKEQKKGLRS